MKKVKRASTIFKKDHQLEEPLFEDVQLPGQVTPCEKINEELKQAIKRSVTMQKKFIGAIRGQAQNALVKRDSSVIDQGLGESTLYPSASKIYQPPPTKINIHQPLNNTESNAQDFNFAELKSAFRQRTEIEMPFLTQQVQDVMYLKEGIIVSLQYNFYQQGVKTTILQPTTKNDLLATGKYQSEGRKNAMSHFNDGIINYEDSGEVYHEYQERNGIGKLMEAQNSQKMFRKVQQQIAERTYYTDLQKQKTLQQLHNDYALVEGSLCIWKTCKDSKLFPDNERSFSMELPYIPTKAGRMQMSVTRDLKVISMLYFHPHLKRFTSNCRMEYNIDDLHFKILSWNLTQDNRFQDEKPGCKYFMIRFSEFNIEIDDQSLKKNKQLIVKYVIFDALTGEIIIEIAENVGLSATNRDGKDIQIHTIGILMKDLPILNDKRMEQYSQLSNYEYDAQYQNEIAIFYAGHLVDFQAKNQDKGHKHHQHHQHHQHPDTAFSYITVDIQQLQKIKEFDFNNKQKRIMNIKMLLQKHCQHLKMEDDNLFCLVNEFGREEWYKDIFVSANKDFKFISLSVLPKIQNEHQKRQFLVYSTKAKSILNAKYGYGNYNKNQKHMALVEKVLNKDQIVRHCRNSHIKQDIFYFLESQTEGFEGCYINFDSNGDNHTGVTRINNEQLNTKKLDIMSYVQEKEDEITHLPDKDKIRNNMIIQILCISKKDKKLQLSTKIPLSQVSRKGQEHTYINKVSSHYLQITASFPIVCRNTSLHQLSIVDIMNRDAPKEYILQLPKDEQFLTFVKFHSYEDIGFYPDFLRIECCTNFLYLTRNNDEVKMNLLLVDPFYDNIQIALFKSSHVISFDDFNEEDIIINSIVCPTRKYSYDNNFQIYIITQYEATINRSMFIEKIEKDDQNSSEHCSNKDRNSNFFDGESDNDAKPSLENVAMLVDSKNFIYYMTKTQGVCSINEINPQESQLRHHTKIAEIKAEQCLAFSIVNKKFYVMDELSAIHVLSRLNNSRELKFNYELNIKEVSRPDIVYKEFKKHMLNDNYYIQGSQIFYLYKDDPYEEGIMEAENLIEDDEEEGIEPKQTQRGPIPFTGSNYFICTHKIGKFKCFLRTYALPDSQQLKLINDFQNCVDMSTFMDNGNVLVKCKNRFMMFGDNGFFLNEVQFDESDQNLTTQEVEKLLKYNIGKAFKNVKHYLKMRNEGSLATKSEEDSKIQQKREAFVFGSEVLDKVSKMELVQISYNNSLFLFFNRISKQFSVFKIQESSKYSKEMKTDFLRQVLEKLKEKTKQAFTFKLQYKLDFAESNIYKYVLEQEMANNHPIDHMINDILTVRLHDTGNVIMSYIVANEQNDDEIHSNFMIIVTLFKQDQRHFNFTKSFQLKKVLLQQAYQRFDYYVQTLVDKQSLLKQRQWKLPPSQQDFSQIEIIENQIQFYKHKKYSAISQRIFNNIILAWCGNCLLYSFFECCDTENPKICDFIESDISFSDFTEIVRVLDTANPQVFQIIAKDHEINVFIVLTWDFKNNMEVQQHQTKLIKDKDGSIKVVKGMNHKMNYFVDSVYVDDLQDNTPLLCVPNTKDDEVCLNKIHKLNNMVIDKLDNQKKVFKNNDIFLDVEQPSVINHGLCRMDLVFWENIERKGVSPRLFETNVSLDKFIKFYSGQSLFHYFIGDSELIKVIHDKYLMAKNQDKLDSLVEKLPLTAMCPDYEMNTALDHCIEMENLKSFEYIIDLVTDFPGICLTNRMIQFIPLMLNRQSESFLNFFSRGQFKSLSMDNTLLINWKKDTSDEFVFPSNTSIISKHLIEKEMANAGLLDTKAHERCKTLNQNISIKNVTQYEIIKKVLSICHEASKATGKKREIIDKIYQISKEFGRKEAEMLNLRNKEEQVLLDPDNIDFYSLNANQQDDDKGDEESRKRINIEALEFDWIFNEDNAENLISILAQVDNLQILTTKPIMMFIDFMWSYYKSAIIIQIFIPYVIYMVTFIYLTSGVISDVIERDYNDPESIKHFHHVCPFPALLTTISSILFIMFASTELSALCDDSPYVYFQDIWNWIDQLSIWLNFIFLAIITISQVTEQLVIDEYDMRLIGGFCCFFMWIKVFYWMRLFESLAKYVNLIQRTIADCLKFMALVLIIIFSFTNFFYVINLNMQDVGGSYVPLYSNESSMLDSFLSVYFICIGMYDVSRFGQGHDETYVWLMFILGSFINLIVFMNMLIAIMAKTFSDVMDKELQSAILERIGIIADHIWIVDYKRIFKGKKYLIKVSQVTNEDNEVQDISDYLNVLETNFNRKFEHLHHVLMKKVLGQDDTSRAFYKILQESKNCLTKITAYVEQQQDQEKKNKVNILESNTEMKSELDSVLAKSRKPKSLVQKLDNSMSAAATEILAQLKEKLEGPLIKEYESCVSSSQQDGSMMSEIVKTKKGTLQGSKDEFIAADYNPQTSKLSIPLKDNRQKFKKDINNIQTSAKSVQDRIYQLQEIYKPKATQESLVKKIEQKPIFEMPQEEQTLIQDQIKKGGSIISSDSNNIDTSQKSQKSWKDKQLKQMKDNAIRDQAILDQIDYESSSYNNKTNKQYDARAKIFNQNTIQKDKNIQKGIDQQIKALEAIIKKKETKQPRDVSPTLLQKYQHQPLLPPQIINQDDKNPVGSQTQVFQKKKVKDIWSQQKQFLTAIMPKAKANATESNRPNKTQSLIKKIDHEISNEIKDLNKQLKSQNNISSIQNKFNSVVQFQNQIQPELSLGEKRHNSAEYRQQANKSPLPDISSFTSPKQALKVPDYLQGIGPVEPFQPSMVETQGRKTYLMNKANKKLLIDFTKYQGKQSSEDKQQYQPNNNNRDKLQKKK